MVFTVNPSACPQNHTCPITVICPAGAISQNGYGLPVIDGDKCIECGKCTLNCPMRAIETRN